MVVVIVQLFYYFSLTTMTIETVEVTNQSTDASSLVRLTTEWVVNEYVSVGFVCILFPFILASNLMVITSVSKYKKLQMPTNYFITSLAVADIVVAFTLPFYVVTELTPIKIYDNYVCFAPNRVLMTVGGVSVLTLATIACDRYTAIMNPLEYIKIMTTGKIIGCILFSWIYSFIVTWIPVLIGWYKNIADHSYLCTSNALDVKSDILFLCLLFIPACVCILFCYIRIYFVAQHHAKAIAAVEQSFKRNIEHKFRRSDTKYAKTLAVVIGVFLCLWLPHQLCLGTEIIYGKVTSHWIKNYLLLLALINSGVNPWVYAYQNSDFRAAYKKISMAWRCKRRLPCTKVEVRRESIVSCISVVPASLLNLHKTNSRIIASDILYALSQHVTQDHIDISLVRKLSAKQSIVNAVSSLPDLLQMYVNTYPDKCLDILEESTQSEGNAKYESRDSACFLTEHDNYIDSNDSRRTSARRYSIPVFIHVAEAFSHK